MVIGHSQIVEQWNPLKHNLHSTEVPVPIEENELYRALASMKGEIK